jgi:hypothetical protein
VSVELLLVLAVLGLAVLVIAGPLRAGRAAEREAGESAERAELEAAKAAKYAEIRDAELDYRTGKLSEEDWRWLDRRLRREAVEVLHRLDALEEDGGEPARSPTPPRPAPTRPDAPEHGAHSPRRP